MIEHPFSIPQEIKKYLDLTSGRDKGRIYRVVPDGFKQPAIPKLGSASTAELVTFLEHPNAWHRETAARLLYTRQDESAIAALRKLAVSSTSPLGRMHALAALQGLRGLNAQVLLAALSDESPRLREHAIKLAEPFAATSPELTHRLCALASDPDVRVRYQLAFTLGEVSAPERLATLSQILQHNFDDEWIRLAVFSSLARDADVVFNTLAAIPDFRQSSEGKAILSQLAGQIGQQAQPGPIAAVLKGIEKLPDQDQSLAAQLVGRLSTGLSRTRSPLLASIRGRNATLLHDSVKQAREYAVIDSSQLQGRLDAIRTLRLGQFAELRETFAQLLTQSQRREVQQETLLTLGSFTDATVADVIVSAWSGLSPFVRRSATETLFSRPAWLVTFLTAVEQEQIPRGDLDMGRLPQLRTHADPQVRAKGEALAKKFQIGRRGDVLAAYRPALTMKGDPQRGRQTFRKTCFVCHRLEGVGYEIGPSLATIKTRGADAILLNLLDPNREVNPQFVNYQVESKAGKTYTGLVAGETATSVSLKRAENQTDTILRIDIEAMRSTGLSLMPEGLEKDLDKQAIADLIAFLLQVN